MQPPFDLDRDYVIHGESLASISYVAQGLREKELTPNEQRALGTQLELLLKHAFPLDEDQS